MEFTNGTYVQILELQKRLKELRSQFHQETLDFVKSLTDQGWTEVYHEEEDLGYGDVLSGAWWVLSPSVPESVVEEAKRDRCFDPEDEGLSEQDYYDLD